MSCGYARRSLVLFRGFRPVQYYDQSTPDYGGYCSYWDGTYAAVCPVAEQTLEEDVVTPEGAGYFRQGFSAAAQVAGIVADALPGATGAEPPETVLDLPTWLHGLFGGDWHSVFTQCEAYTAALQGVDWGSVAQV